MPFCLPFFRKPPASAAVLQMNPARKTTLREEIRRHSLAHADHRAVLIAALERHHTQLSRSPIDSETVEHRAAELHYAGELIRVLKNLKVTPFNLQRILNETFIALDRHCKSTRSTSQICDLIAALEDSPAFLSGLGLTHIFPREAGDAEYHLLLQYRVNLSLQHAVIWLDGKPHYRTPEIHTALCETLTKHHAHLTLKIAATHAEQAALLLTHSGRTEALFKSAKKITALQLEISNKVKEREALQVEQRVTHHLITMLDHQLNKKIDPEFFESHMRRTAALGASCELAQLALYLNNHDAGFKKTYAYASAPVVDDFPDWDFAGGSFSSDSVTSNRASSGSVVSTLSFGSRGF